MALAKTGSHLDLRILLAVLTLVLVMLVLAPDCQGASYTLLVTAANGTVQKNPDKEVYDAGEVVELIPLPLQGYCFDRWSGDLTSRYLVGRVTMTANKAVTANFVTWHAPIGIPTPSFGITETYRYYDTPANRNGNLTYNESPVGGYYTHYVDCDNPAATDSDNLYGTVAKPRKTLGDATYPEGSVVEIHGSTYTLGGDGIRLHFDGTVTQPVFFRGTSIADRPMLTSKLYLTGQYAIVENLQGNYNGIDIHPSTVTHEDIHHIAIRNYKIRGTGQFRVGNGIQLYSEDATAVVHDCVIFSCDASYLGDWQAVSEDDNSCFPMPSKHYNTWVLDSLGHHSGGDGVPSGHGGGVHNLYIGRNIFYNNRENGVDLKTVTDVVVSENDIHHHYAVSSSSGEDIVLHDAARGIWVLYNTLYDARFGVLASDTYDVCVIGNVFYDIDGPIDRAYPGSPYRDGVGVMWWNAGPIKVVGNTFSDCIIGVGADLGGLGTVITNNIITDINDVRTGHAISLQGSVGMAASVIQNNIFYQSRGDVLYYWGGGTIKGLSAFQSTSGKGQNCLETAPRLVSPATRDFHLQSSSPAINAGVEDSVYDGFYSHLGADIKRDVDGVSRPQDSAWDVGAYEYILGPVTDLAVSGTGRNSVTLRWTVPGEEGVTGRPATYDIRYAGSVLTEADWGAATPVSGEPPAGAFGQPQSFTIAGLNPGTTCYLAMRTVDEAGHRSTLSNVVSGTTTLSGNYVPVWTPIGDRSVVQNSTLTFSVLATDADGDTLTYSAPNLPARASFDPATRTFVWTPADTPSGTYWVTFQVTDGQAAVSQTITITVYNPLNHAPVLAPIDNPSVSEGASLQFAVSATDPDGDLLVYSVITGLPPGASFADRTFRWTPTAGQAGSYQVTFTVSDGQLTDSGTVTITVTSVAKDQIAPVVTQCAPAPDAIQVALNNLVSLHITDAGAGVDANTVVIRVNGGIVYQGNADTYTSGYGLCSRSGTGTDYEFIYQAGTMFDFDQLVTVVVDAADKAGNVMSEFTYSFTTQMRAFGKNQGVSLLDAYADSRPVTICDPAGNIWVAWQNTSQDNRGIYVARLLVGSDVFETPIRLTSSNSDQRNPRMAVTATGDVYVVWQDNRHGNWDIYASVCSAGGSFSTEVQVTTSNRNEVYPVIAIDHQPQACVYVAWQDDRNGNADIYVASTTNVFAAVAESRVTNSAADQTAPALVVDGGNTAYVFWTDTRNGQADIYGAASGPSGSNPAWTNVPIVAGVGDQSQPAAAATPEGSTLHLLWVDNASGNNDIHYAVLNGLPGSPVAGACITDDTSGADQSAPAVVCGADGRVFACWQDPRRAGGANMDTDLYLAELRAGAAGTNVFLGDDGTNANQSDPAIGLDRFGQPYVVWTDYRRTATEIYYAATTLIDPNPLRSQVVTASAGACVGTDPAAVRGPQDVSLVVPPGALRVDLRIAISEVLNPPIPTDTLLTSYEFSPSGIRFDQPVTVTIPYIVPSGSPRVLPYWYDALTGSLSQQGITDVRNLSVSSRLNALQFRTTHFTPFYLVEVSADNAPVGGGAGGGGCAISPSGGSPSQLLVPYAAIAAIMAILQRKDRRQGAGAPKRRIPR